MEYMNVFNFAHLGVHHATQAEAIAHEFSTSAWVVMASAIVGLIVYASVKRSGSRESDETRKEDQER